MTKQTRPMPNKRPSLDPLSMKRAPHRNPWNSKTPSPSLRLVNMLCLSLKHRTVSCPPFLSLKQLFLSPTPSLTLSLGPPHHLSPPHPLSLMFHCHPRLYSRTRNSHIGAELRHPLRRPHIHRERNRRRPSSKMSPVLLQIPGIWIRSRT